MSLYASLYNAISGLTVNGIQMSVIGDNLANMNTIGYKASRASFQDLMASSVAGSSSQSFMGQGSILNQIDQQMKQGSFASTGNGLDLGIHGSGFFIVAGNIGGVTTNFYTRDGQFHVNNKGYLVSAQGMEVQGWTIDTAGDRSSTLGGLQFKDATSPAKATTGIELALNLSAEETIIPGGFDLTDADGSSNFSTTVTVYDSLGAARDVSMYFTKTADGEWSWNAVVAADDTASGLEEIQASGTLSFDSDGKLVTQTTASSSFNFAGGSTANQAITFDFGDDVTGGGSGLSGSTQFATSSSVTDQSQDGFPPGDMSQVVIDETGVITGTFTNGQRRVVGQIALADFRGAGLQRMGSNLWLNSTASGEPLIGEAGSGSRGVINNAVLEQSNVDMSSEFVTMITAQRGYQANARTVSTADQMMQEALNMKR